MAPPHTEDTLIQSQGSLVHRVEQLDLKHIARKQGKYIVFPETKYPELESFEHHDPGHKADPAKNSLYNNAEKIFDLTPHIGTEVHGLQLSQLTDQQKNDLALLVAERGVVFFRNQDITPHQGVELGRYFGRPHIHNTFGHPEGLPELHIIYFDENSSTKGYEHLSFADIWHTDVSYEVQPAGLTFLKIDTLPEVGGDTLWASGYAAYEKLSPAFQKFLEGLEAVHSGQHQIDEAVAQGRPVRRRIVESIHPVVRTHPVTGWKSLYVQPYFTRRIVGLSPKESTAILNYLYQLIATSADFQVRFKWTEDSVAVWDNRVTFHNAIFDYLGSGKRHGWRVTPQAEKPYLDPNSKSKKEALQEKKA
ncbi:uncharacterized protein BYT42DRAFT_594807 [Radiomyces spectabilis]|uniref:uncharacterized protein n=1 Tax=Radiomyces spectabilis TaxID=64574 RepID=UPI002220CD8B|nr:uncharacterized protein BYT42DRAFT_594807 [Radiomyces spectabilis]KAI8372942.1 hypothetical protein BYT42DRAFT_594807 [Radiomyces spectabilis]